jgi:hypothetical protein
VVESSGLLNRRRGLNLYRGFESPPLRHIFLFKINNLQLDAVTVADLYATMRVNARHLRPSQTPLSVR